MFFLTNKMLRGIRERVEDLERAQKRLADEWDDMAALLRRRAGNAARQLQRLEEKEQGQEAVRGQLQETESPRLDPVSERILARRRRIANPEVEQ